MKWSPLWSLIPGENHGISVRVLDALWWFADFGRAIFEWISASVGWGNVYTVMGPTIIWWFSTGSSSPEGVFHAWYCKCIERAAVKAVIQELCALKTCFVKYQRVPATYKAWLWSISGGQIFGPQNAEVFAEKVTSLDNSTRQFCQGDTPIPTNRCRYLPISSNLWKRCVVCNQLWQIASAVVDFIYQ